MKLVINRYVPQNSGRCSGNQCAAGSSAGERAGRAYRSLPLPFDPHRPPTHSAAPHFHPARAVLVQAELCTSFLTSNQERSLIFPGYSWLFRR
ncbi:hypothetical protein Y032_0002g992 [Ancylostoma ceylanicum]|uniref:Uncharacterized protein n=1 Tax=Ancylostoma ceylanicum TaxID=53326 RepID=A0A016W2G9_9BILA|nr:hypothetical protein Y032_0002g992 [Ancylostoma ceylanicum]